MEAIKLNTNELHQGMIISKDVITSDGTFLIRANTVVTKNLILKLELYKIPFVFIKVNEPEETESSVTSSKSFKKFSKKYHNNIESIESEFDTIISKGNVDQNNLLSLTQDVLTELNTSSNVFNYLCRLKSKDDTTYTHALNVAILSSIFGKWLDLHENDIRNLIIAGILHDIGKLKIDDAVLNKPGKLTDAEFAIMKKHPTIGYEMVANLDLHDGIKQAILFHHVKMDGKGYPDTVSWDKVHPYAKIISIIDIYDAMTSERPYHQRYHPFTVIKMFEEDSYGILDTRLLFVFLKNIAHNFLGTEVILSTGEKGKIIFINESSPSRPLIQLDNGNVINLIDNFEINIDKFL